MNIERELVAALRRTTPPVGFSDRVLSRIHEETSSRARGRTAYAGRWTRMVAAVLLIVSTGLLSSRYVMEIREDAAGERAKQELVLAMRIASEKTNLARQEVMTLTTAGGTEEGDRQ